MNVNPMFVMMAIEAISKLLALKQSGAVDSIKREVEELIEKLKQGLPKKDDGTDWTDDDIQLAAAAARLPWNRILDLTGGR